MKYILVILILLQFSCTGNAPSNPDSQFDRTRMLDFTAKQIIIPMYADVLSHSQTLDSLCANFMLQANETTITEMRQAWRSLAISWQYCSMFDFGPAEFSDGTLFENIGTYPVSVTKIISKIETKDTLFANFDRDTRGIYAIEYLLFNDSLNTYKLLTNKANNDVKYLKNLIQHVITKVQTVHNAWINGYSQTFIQNTGVQAGSSISELYNSFVHSYELMKNYQCGLPFGLKVGQVSTEPTKTEGFYSGISTELLYHHNQALLYFWRGYARLSPLSSLSGIGFKDYLLSIPTGKQLVDDTEYQWEQISKQISLLDRSIPLSVMIDQKMPILLDVFTELSKHTHFLKSDMSSLLGISITYTSNDGD